MTHGGLILHVEKNASERGLFFCLQGGSGGGLGFIVGILA